MRNALLDEIGKILASEGINVFAGGLQRCFLYNDGFRLKLFNQLFSKIYLILFFFRYFTSAYQKSLLRFFIQENDNFVFKIEIDPNKIWDLHIFEKCIFDQNLLFIPLYFFENVEVAAKDFGDFDMLEYFVQGFFILLRK